MGPRKLYPFLLTFLLIIYLRKTNTQTLDDAKDLLKKLFITDAYNKVVRPTCDQSATTNVSMSFYLTGIIDFDSQKEILTTSGYINIVWNDCKLIWNPLDYNNTYYILVPQDSVWTPDVDLRNSMSKLKGLGSSNFYLSVYNNGSVEWYPYGTWKSACNVDITYFPFDTQSCDLKFGTWAYTTGDVSITVDQDAINLTFYEENTAWTIVETSVNAINYMYSPVAVFTIKLNRKPLFFLLNILLPVIMLSLLNVCIFVLPAQSGEKASFAVTVFLSLVIFLSIVMGTLPQNSEEISFLGVYLVIMAAFSTLAVILTMFQIRLNSRDADVDPIPSWLIKLQVMVEVIRCRRCSKVHPATYSQDEVVMFSSDRTNLTGDTTSEKTKSKPQASNQQPIVTWNQICSSLDFVFFWVFSIGTVITSVTIVAIYNIDQR
ncbi:hypothetical protein CHS0354_011035 [Potamilus streckersoni]|uniref:Uncharacterized protein n=1 Tax=Potamilus streckersoni TaxID=2493646 RepID=A0AAE0WH43_9BIVA|nr:hypothetical protein CHS0354_011035 [Potamilus streckersoni]